MRSPAAAIKHGGRTLRFASRSAATAVALAAHIAALLMLVYDPTDKLVVDEPSGPISVEIVAVPSNGSAAARTQAAVAEPTVAAEWTLPTLADERPLAIADREEAIVTDDRTTVPTPRPKPTKGHKTAPPHIQPATSFALSYANVQVRETSRISDSSESGSTGISDTNPEPVDIPSTWKARLLSHLESYKRYPNTARTSGAEGTVLLSFSMDHDGRVLGYYLVRSSGRPELDDEAFAMIARASPLPPVPPEVRAQVVQLVVPVRFRM